MPANLHVALAECTGNDANGLFHVRFFDPKQVFGKPFTKPPVYFHKAVNRRGAVRQPAAVDPFLYLNVGFCSELQISPAGVGAVVVLECPLDVKWMGVVPFYQIAVITVHCTDERGERRQEAIRQTAAKTGGLHGQFDRQVGQIRSVSGAIANPHRLHLADAFAVIVDRA